DSDLLVVAGTIPLLLSMGAITAGQTTIYTVSLLGSADLDTGFSKHVLTETALSLFYALLFGLSSYWIFEHVFEVDTLSVGIAAALSLQLVLAAVFGSVLPVVLEKL